MTPPMTPPTMADAAGRRVGVLNLEEALAEAKSFADFLSLLGFRNANGHPWSLGPEGGRHIAAAVAAWLVSDAVVERAARAMFDVWVNHPMAPPWMREAGITWEWLVEKSVTQPDRPMTKGNDSAALYVDCGRKEARAALTAAGGGGGDVGGNGGR